MLEKTQAEKAEEERDDWEWMIVEVFGHRKHAGRTREEERFGAKFLRIDIPIKGDPSNGWTTHYYGGSALFSVTLSDEATCLQINKPYEAPSRLTYVQADLGIEDVDDGGDDEPF